MDPSGTNPILIHAKRLTENGNLKEAQDILKEGVEAFKNQKATTDFYERIEEIQEDILTQYLCYQALLQDEKACLELLTKIQKNEL